MPEKKVVVELSKIRELSIQLRPLGEEWGVFVSYTLSDEANTVRRSGNLEFSIDGKQTVEELHASIVLMIETKEGMQ